MILEKTNISEMPKSCDKCPMWFRCELPLNENYKTERNNKCPLIEIPNEVVEKEYIG